MTPHNTFEWFVKHFTRSECKQCKKATDELICHSCASTEYDKKYSKEEVEQLLEDFSKQFNMACDWRDGITKDYRKSDCFVVYKINRKTS